MNRLISALLITAIITLSLPLVAFSSEQGQWEYQFYNYDNNTPQSDDDIWGVELITYRGEKTDITVPETIAIDGTEYPVLKLGSFVFSHEGSIISSINSVSLPQSLRVIGNFTFLGATSLVCVVANDNLAQIGEEAFSGCTHLNSIMLEDNVINIERDAFKNCNELTIYCNDNSYAHNYAKSTGIKVKIMSSDTKFETVKEGNITYFLSGDEAIVMSYDKSAFENDPDKTLENVVIPEKINNCTVTKIHNKAFENCLIGSIDLPDTITSIGDYAFNNLYTISEIELPANLTYLGEEAFCACNNILSIEIPEGVTEIRSNTFSDCQNLQKVTLPDTMKTIGDSAFSDCWHLEEINLPEGLEEIRNWAFAECGFINIELPNSLNNIYNGAFTKCTSLESIKIPEKLTSIAYGAFEGCTKLSNVILHDNISCIDSLAFANCEGLESITVPESVESIGDNAFGSAIMIVTENSFVHEFAVENDLLYFISSNNSTPEIKTVDNVKYFLNGDEATIVCYKKPTDECGTDESLADVEIPEKIDSCTVTRIYDKAFENCLIGSIDLPDTITSIGNYAFNDVFTISEIELPANLTYLGDGAFIRCNNILSIEIPDGVTEIRSNTFSNCQNLQKVTLPDTMKTIGDSAFSGCWHLEEINLPEGLEEIWNWAFAECGFVNIELPNSLNNIYNGAFTKCTSLESIKIPEKLTSIAYGVFDGCTKLSNVILHDNITCIDSLAFANCESLESITIPESVESIGDNAFGSAIMIVTEKSFAHEFAVENDLLYFIREGDSIPTIKIEGSIKYLLSDDEATVISYDTSAYENDSNKALADVVIPEKVDNCTVTRIYDKAFENCPIGSIDLPYTITSIGNYAFNNVFTISEIELPENLTYLGEGAFCACNNILSIEIPDAVTEIRSNTFSNCQNLQKVTLPDTMKTIGDSAFSGCWHLEEINLPEGLEEIWNWAFAECNFVNIELPNSLKNIFNGAFTKCTSLECIKIPEKLTSIAYGVFDGCTKLSNVILHDNITCIDSLVFANCESLESITIPESVESIGDNAFGSAVMIVYDGSFAHSHALQNGLPNFVIYKTFNTEVYYGTALSGTVTNSDGDLIGRAEVSIFYDDGTHKETVLSDASGTYEFTYVEVGKYKIRATDENGAVGEENISVRRKNAFDVFVSGKTDIVVKTANTVSGKVLGDEVTVTITDLNGIFVDETKTVNGAFAFSRISNGTYILKAENSKGSICKEITVFNSDIEGIELSIIEERSTLTGVVTDEDGNVKIWADVTLYNEEGLAVGKCKTDLCGKFTFDNLINGEYAVLAEATALKKDETLGYYRMVTLTGHGYIKINGSDEYNIGTVVATAEAEDEVLGEISGKVMFDGVGIECDVLLKDILGNEKAKTAAGSNGQYKFLNVKDGIYFVIAKTRQNGMGLCIVMLKDGKTYGKTDITVYKSGKIAEFEDMISKIPFCNSRDEAMQYQYMITQLKGIYDRFSEKDKEQLNPAAKDKLNYIIELISDTKYNVNDEYNRGVMVSGGGSISNTGEIESGAEVKIDVTIEDIVMEEIDGDGIKTDNQFIRQQIEDMTGGKGICGHYDISMKKGVKNAYGEFEYKEINDISKDSDTTGRIKITMPIPKEYREHKNYYVVHVHGGVAESLIDLDDNPDTITFETDKFSTFTLCYSDVQTAQDMTNADKITVKLNCDEDVRVYEVIYDIEGRVASLKVHSVSAQQSDKTLTVSKDAKIYVWNKKLNKISNGYVIE